MKEEVEINWKEHFQFNTSFNSHLLIDIPPEKGGDGKGISPKKLLLLSLAGCTGMDVIAILRDHDKLPTSLRIKVTGTQDAHSEVLTAIHILYTFETQDVFKKISQQSVDSSLNHYCSIGQLLRKGAIITSEVIFK